MSLCFSLIVGDILVLVHASLGGLLGWGAFGACLVVLRGLQLFFGISVSRGFWVLWVIFGWEGLTSCFAVFGF
jgi:hypothetical protein